MDPASNGRSQVTIGAVVPGAALLEILTFVLILQCLGYGQSEATSAPPAIFHHSTSNVSANQDSPESNFIQANGGSKPEPHRCSLMVPDFRSQTAAESQTPKASSNYVPLSPRCKFHLFLMQTHSPYTFAGAGFQATLDQAQGQWPHYGGGLQGFGKRYGATLADTESRRFIQGFALSTLLHQDPRYFPSNRKRLIARAWYAATRVVVVRSDDGPGTFNSSEFLGTLVTSSLQNAYYPKPDRTLGDTLSRFAGGLSSDLTSDLLREFTPDLKRIFRKHAPKEIKNIEEKLPIPEDDKP